MEHAVSTLHFEGTNATLLFFAFDLDKYTSQSVNHKYETLDTILLVYETMIMACTKINVYNKACISFVCCIV